MSLLVPKMLQFARRILSDFFLQNHGLLLTSAVAYNTLLSLIPLSAVLIIIFSKFFEEGLLLEMVTAEVGLIAPGATEMLNEVLTAFLETRELAGLIGVGVLLFFSSVAFRVLENAIGIIFERPTTVKRRKFWVSALLPYVFIALLGLGLLVLTTVASFFESTYAQTQVLAPFEMEVSQMSGVVLRFAGWLMVVLLFTTLYIAMPSTKISFRLALWGGVTAAILWEGLRYLLTGYFLHISFVSVVYGSMATTIIALLTMEAAALIVLLGAQVIADLQRSRLGNVPWYEDPGDVAESENENPARF